MSDWAVGVRNPQPIQSIGATLVVARAGVPAALVIATRMRIILDTRPKGAPGRDKPVPYERFYPRPGKGVHQFVGVYQMGDV